MNSKQILSLLLGALSLLAACKPAEEPSDATGTFEAVETIISSEASGVLRQFDVDEGQVLDSARLVGYVDTTQLYLRKKQLLSQIRTTLSQKPNIPTQLAALQAQIAALEKERARSARLVRLDAAPAKQLDDIDAQLQVLRKQLAGQRSALQISSGSIGEQVNPIAVQIEQINDQLARCRIINPVLGTVLGKYAETYELLSPGKALYKIADLRTLELKAYVSAAQFARIRIGQEVQVLVDAEQGKQRTYRGRISWISDQAEFTPKTIQTREERANLVYAIKIRVANDGLLKIGMYGEVQFTTL